MRLFGKKVCSFFYWPLIIYCSVLQAVDYLLWAAVCMESIVPLLGVKYLSWRVTLYSAICLAYYDCKASHHAEVDANFN